MKLTFDEAIENHRKMWNWIADETEKRKVPMEEKDYFEENGVLDAFMESFCCEYGSGFVANTSGIAKCMYCPIDWGVENYGMVDCEEYGSLYYNWKHCIDYKKCAKYARQIANLPARREKIEC